MNKGTRRILVSLALVSCFFSLSCSLFLSSSSTFKTASAWSGEQTSAEGTYYESARGLKGTSLLNQLNSIISAKCSTSYDWSRYEKADEAEGDSTSVLMVYARTTMKKTAHVSGSTGWNREHSFPQSKMTGAATSDNHIIFASDCKVNGARGNLRLNEVSHDSSNIVKDCFGKNTECYKDSGYFEPCDDAKGEVARSTMYAAAKYGYEVNNNIYSTAMCLDWNISFLPTNREIYRNNANYSQQGNRNPFIDHPEFAKMIWDSSYSGEGALNDTGVTKVITSIALTRITDTIYSGQERTLVNTVTYEDSSTSANPSLVKWSSSNMAVATVDSRGILHAVSEGSSTIGVTANGLSDSMDVTVTASTFQSISYSGTPKTQYSGNSFDPQGLVFTGTYNYGDSNIDSSLISFSPTAMAIGTTEVTASYLGKSVTITGITVTEPSGTGFGDPITRIADMQDGDYLITATSGTTDYYFPCSGSEIATGTTTLASFTDVSDVDAGNVFAFNKNADSSYSVKSGSLYLNCTTTNDGIGVGATSDSWTLSDGASGIYMRSNNGGRYLNTYDAGSEWRGYATANTNGSASIVLYPLASTNPEDLEEAVVYSETFLDRTSHDCSLLQIQSEDTWSELSSSYSLLGAGAKDEFVSNGKNVSIVSARERYVYIIDKYPTLENFVSGISRGANKPIVINDESSTLVFLAVVIGSVSLASVLVITLARKKKRK